MGFVICKRSCVRVVGGRSYVVKSGSILHDNDPVVVGAEQNFVRVEDVVQCYVKHPESKNAPVEQATAAPGEKRVTRSRPPKKERSVAPVESPEKDAKEESKDA